MCRTINKRNAVVMTRTSNLVFKEKSVRFRASFFFYLFVYILQEQR